jgi:hypothetical protein
MAGIIAAILAASFTVHTPFAIIDNGGVPVTRQPLTVHQVVFCGGVAEQVVAVHPLGTASYELRLIPALPAKDAGKVVTCDT